MLLILFSFEHSFIWLRSLFSFFKQCSISYGDLYFSILLICLIVVVTCVCVYACTYVVCASTLTTAPYHGPRTTLELVLPPLPLILLGHFTGLILILGTFHYKNFYCNLFQSSLLICYSYGNAACGCFFHPRTAWVMSKQPWCKISYKDGKGL